MPLRINEPCKPPEILVIYFCEKCGEWADDDDDSGPECWHCGEKVRLRRLVYTLATQ